MAVSMGGPRVWFITGCSSDFGRELAALVLRRGGRAVLAGRDLSTFVDLVTSYPTAARAVPLDINEEAQIADAAADAVAIAQGAFRDIDVLVNIPEGPEAAGSASASALTKAVLSAMCERGKGHVVNVGPSSDNVSETLAEELAPFGIKMSTVEPNIETVFRLVEAPGAALTPNGRSDPERLRRILARLSDAAIGATPISVNLGAPAKPEMLRRSGTARSSA
jgi:NAD(P)-dependent dehydrogenase (short-subunit alcohol dehydrogenase family)